MSNNEYNKTVLKRYSRKVKLFNDEVLAKRVFTYIERGSKSTHNYKKNNQQNKAPLGSKNSKEVLVKITGNSKNFEAFKAHIDYLTRDNKLEIKLNENEVFKGKEETELFKDIYNDLGSPIPRQNKIKGKEKREVMHIVFSMKEHETTPKEKLEKAVMQTIQKKYPNNQSAFVYHGDTDNPHVHVVLKVKDKEGKRLDIRKKDLAELRKGFAKNLNDLGIEAYATIKRDYDRKKTKAHHYKVVEYGHAKYKFSKDEHAQDSYYIKYETTKGKYTYIWSKDLEKVVHENNVKIGEYARFKIVGKEPVTVEIKKKVNGNIIKFKKEVTRSIWDCSVLGREKELKDPPKTKGKKVKYSIVQLINKLAEFRKSKNKTRSKTKGKFKTKSKEQDLEK